MSQVMKRATMFLLTMLAAAVLHAEEGPKMDRQQVLLARLAEQNRPVTIEFRHGGNIEAPGRPDGGKRLTNEERAELRAAVERFVRERSGEVVDLRRQ